MVDEGKKPSGEASGSNNNNIVSIDINDPLYLHSNVTNDGKCVKPDPKTSPFLDMQWERCNSIVLTWILNCVSADLFVRQVFSSNAKTMWDELAETYDKVDGSVIFNFHHKINIISQSGSLFDGASSYKDHAQLLKLIEFVMGLDDVYAPIRSTILVIDPLLTVNEAFYLLLRDESHRLSHSGGSGVKGNNSAFVSRPSGDSRGSSTSFVPRSGDNRRRFNNSTVRNNNL
ncbi:hypothetical protein Tco_1398050, partial [Tanacetum coccineum]